MSSYVPDPAKVQARTLLQTLCKFILPAIQMALREKTTDFDQFLSGSKADELLIEMEKFVSGIISRSRPSTKDIAIEATLGKHSNYPAEDVKASPEHTLRHQNTQRYAIARPISSPTMGEKALDEELRKLRKDINQKMPIRLLCFEPHNSKLKISLLERHEIYDYLAPKVLADFNNGQSPTYWKHTRYAILSHTWTQTPGELIYGDWQKGLLGDNHPKCRKLVNFCKVAWEKHGLTLGWIDTVCINKESSAELDESIRSMYAWYSNANVCIAYLAGTNRLSDIRNDPWFKRGWTLQELVAPLASLLRCIKFYNVGWTQLSECRNDSEDPLILEEIELATTITKHELHNIREISISRRMQLAANRQVTREEDIAYCLMGIFDVSISTAYGEGADRAFFRLVREIFSSTKDVLDIFNWAGRRQDWALSADSEPVTTLFPSAPSDYLHRSSNDRIRSWNPIEPLTLTHLGLRTPMLLMPAIPIGASVSANDPWPVGGYNATVSIDLFEFAFVPSSYHLLDKRVSGSEGLHAVGSTGGQPVQLTLTFGALNVQEHPSGILVPKTPLAVLLKRFWRPGEVETSSTDYTKVETQTPIVFDLQKTRSDPDDKENEFYYLIERDQLAHHGMKLVTLYL